MHFKIGLEGLNNCVSASVQLWEWYCTLINPEVIYEK